MTSLTKISVSKSRLQAFGDGVCASALASVFPTPVSLTLFWLVLFSRVVPQGGFNRCIAVHTQT